MNAADLFIDSRCSRCRKDAWGVPCPCQEYFVTTDERPQDPPMSVLAHTHEEAAIMALLYNPSYTSGLFLAHARNTDADETLSFVVRVGLQHYEWGGATFSSRKARVERAGGK